MEEGRPDDNIHDFMTFMIYVLCDDHDLMEILMSMMIMLTWEAGWGHVTSSAKVQTGEGVDVSWISRS